MPQFKRWRDEQSTYLTTCFVAFVVRESSALLQQSERAAPSTPRVRHRMRGARVLLSVVVVAGCNT